MFSIYLLNFSDQSKAINSTITILTLLILLSIPALFARLLHKNRAELQSEPMKAKIGSIYLGIRTSNFAQRFYSSAFLIRRMLYALLTILCINNPNILIHVFLLTNILYTVYLGLTNPHD